MTADEGRTAAALDEDRAAELSAILHALAHPLRIRIVALLARSEEHVTALSEALGATQPVVSQQLAILRMRGLVAMTRRDGHVYYHVTDRRLRQLIRAVDECREALGK